MFPFTFPTGSLPDELGLFVPLALLVGVVAILLVRRGGSGAGDDGGARYVGTISLVTLFVALFAAFVAVSALTDLLVDHEARVRGLEQAFNDESYYGPVGVPAGGPGGPILGLGIDFPQYAFSPSDDANYDTAVASGLAAMAAAAVFLVHRRRRIEIVTARGAQGAGAVAVNRTYLQSVKAVASLTFALGAAAALYGVWQIIAPGIAGAIDADVGRAEGISAAVSAGLLALATALIFVRAENELGRS